MSAPKLSFTFAKSKKPNLIPPPGAEVDKKPETQELREYITAIEDNVINSTKPAEKPLVIPVIHSQFGIRQKIRELQQRKEHHLKKYDSNKPLDELTQKALEEIKQDAKESDDADTQVSANGLKIPLANRNLSSNQTEDINYESVPVEKFGLAILAGMGFDPEILKSADKQPVGPIRPKGLGLGADPRAAKAAKEHDKPSQDSKKKLTWSTGAHCQVVMGKHEGLYGVVNGLDGDTGRVIIKLTLSKEVISVLQPIVRLVPEQEYKVYASCLNQAEVNRYKSEEATVGDRHSDKSSVPNGKRSRVADDVHSMVDTKPHFPAIKPDPDSRYATWVRPNLRVKFLDKRCRNGRYYKEKVSIVNVTSGRCTCRTSSGSLIEDVNPKYLQTVVPRENNTMVMIVHGARDGEMAKLIDQNSEHNEVDLRTRAGTMIQLSYDQICSVADET